MNRKKKRRVIAPVKNPYKELGLPFEGRRMLIRHKDIQDTVSTVSRGPYVTCNNSETRSSSSNLTSEVSHNSGEEKSLVTNDNQKHGRIEMRCDCSSRYHTCAELPDLEEGQTIQPKARNCFVKMPQMKPRLQKNDQRKMYKVGKLYDSDLEESYRIHASTSLNARKHCKHVDGLKHRRKEIQDSNSYKLNLIEDSRLLSSSRAGDEECQTKGKSEDVNHCHVLDGGGFDPNKVSYFGKDTEDDSKSEKEEYDDSKNRLVKEFKNDGIINETDKTHRNRSSEGRGTHTFHVCREKHYSGENESDFSYVIYVNCESSSGNKDFSNANVTKFAKRRRGDISKMRSFVDNTYKDDMPQANQTHHSDSKPNDVEAGDMYGLPHRFVDSTHLNTITSKQSIDELSQQKPDKKASSSKSRMAGRLIDHLERKESKQLMATAGILTRANSTDETEETLNPHGSSHGLAETLNRMPNDHDNKYSFNKNIITTKKLETRLTDGRPNGKISDVVSCIKHNLATMGSSTVSSENNSNETSHPSEEQFSLALANQNDNKKHLRGISNPQSTTLQSTECTNIAQLKIKRGQLDNPIVDRMKCRLETDSDTKDDNALHYSPFRGSWKTSKENDHRGYHNKKQFPDKIRLHNFPNRPQNIGAVTREPCQQYPPTSITIKRVLRPGVVHTTECTRSRGFNCGSLYSVPDEDHLSDTISNKGHDCTSQVKDRSNITLLKSPRPDSANRHQTSSVAHPHEQNKSSQFSPSFKTTRKLIYSSSQNKCSATKQKTTPFPYMLESPTSSQSPEISIAMQNENHSNRRNENFQCDPCSDCASSSSRRSRSPLPRSRNDVVDESGETTLNELSQILEEARANCQLDCMLGDSNTSATCVCKHAPKDKCVSFLGEYLRSLWKRQILCDTKVVVGKDEFLVHKLVLAAYSSVFCPSTPRPEPTVTLNIPNTTSDAVREVFTYMYSSTMTLTDELLEPVLRAAAFLGATEIIDIIKDILLHPTPDNVNLYNSVIRRFDLKISLLDQEKYYREGFSDLKNNAAFLALSLEEFEHILEDPEVMVANEMETIDVIVSWIEYNYLQRISNLRTLLNCVSFESIPPNHLVELVEKYNHIFDTTAGNSFLVEAYKLHYKENICIMSRKEKIIVFDVALSISKVRFHALNYATTGIPEGSGKAFSGPYPVNTDDDLPVFIEELQSAKPNKAIIQQEADNKQPYNMAGSIYSTGSQNSPRDAVKSVIWGQESKKGARSSVPFSSKWNKQAQASYSKSAPLSQTLTKETDLSIPLSTNWSTQGQPLISNRPSLPTLMTDGQYSETATPTSNSRHMGTLPPQHSISERGSGTSFSNMNPVPEPSHSTPAAAVSREEVLTRQPQQSVSKRTSRNAWTKVDRTLEPQTLSSRIEIWNDQRKAQPRALVSRSELSEENAQPSVNQMEHLGKMRSETEYAHVADRDVPRVFIDPKKGNRNRTSHVSFHDTTAEGSPVTPSNKLLIPLQKRHKNRYSGNMHKRTNISQNNNAFRETRLLLQNGSKHLQFSAQQMPSNEVGSDVSSKCLKWNTCSPVHSTKLLTNTGHSVKVDKELARVKGHVDTCIRDRSVGDTIRLSRSISFLNDNHNDNVLKVPETVSFRNKDGTSNSKDQQLLEVQADTHFTVASEVNSTCNECACGIRLVHDRDVKANNTRFQNNKCYKVTDRFKIPRTAAQTLWGSSNIMDDDKSIDNKMCEGSLMVLGHDAQTSAFRVYRPTQ